MNTNKSDREVLLEHVIEARERCVVNHVPRYELLRNLDSDDKTEFLWGSCIQNADVLADYLREQTPYDVSVVHGGLDIPREPVPRDYEEARTYGTVHNWVLAYTPSGTYHCDVACEDSTVGYGNPIVVQTLPKSYIMF
jgi:hypothetical protein